MVKMVKTLNEEFNTEQDTQRGKYLTFMLDNEVYAIEIKLVTEIICLQPITKLPELPPYIKGVVNLRGKIIPVMDVRLRFRMEPIEYNNKTSVIVIDVRDMAIGLIVDNVSEVMAIADDKIVSPPEIKIASENRFINAIGVMDESIKLILDCEKLLSGDDAEVLNAAV